MRSLGFYESGSPSPKGLLVVQNLCRTDTGNGSLPALFLLVGQLSIQRIREKAQLIFDFVQHAAKALLQS